MSDFAMRAIPLYVRTLARLRPRQIFFQVLRRTGFSRTPASVSYAARRTERRAEMRAAVLGILHTLPPSLAVADEVVASRFVFLNEARVLPNPEWLKREGSHLWNYNLHYFDYVRNLAWAWYVTRERDYIHTIERLSISWIEGTRGQKGDGWEPYALSMRIVNWVFALLVCDADLDPAIRAKIEQSLFEQIAALRARLEWHILANHLQKNIHALLIGSLLYDGDEPATWNRFARRLFEEQVLEQVLPDGTHYERSPMYHTIALNDHLEALILLEAAGHTVGANAKARIGRMASALQFLRRSDGDLRPFNDSARGIARDTEQVLDLHASVFGERAEKADGPWALDAGAYRGTGDLRSGSALAICCGEPSPSYQPGHSHCDLLSYEMDFGGRPVVVDSGVHGYGADPFREFVRSTRAHNTVSIGGREQSEIWSTYRVARSARVGEFVAGASGDAYTFAGSYRPYFGRTVRHERRIEYRPGDLTVNDRVEGARGERLMSFIHLHPQFTITTDGDTLVAVAPGVRLELIAHNADRVHSCRGSRTPMQGWYCPEFGRALECTVVTIERFQNDEQSFGYRLTVRAT